MRKSTILIGNAIFVSIFAVLILVLLEIAARMTDAPSSPKVDHNPAAAATFRNLVTAFDDKYSVEEMSKLFPQVQDQLKYQPWIEIGNADHANAFSVVEKGIRKTVAGKKCAAETENGGGRSFKVWFFGGSTTYGIGVPWWSTIPSNFVEEADRNDMCAVVVNYGVPYHFSRQEAVYLASNLRRSTLLRI